MELQIPLGSYPGRGGNSAPISVSYSSKVWGIIYSDTQTNIYDEPLYDELDPAYGQDSVVGWTTSLDVPKVDWGAYSERYSQTGKSGAFCYPSAMDYCHYMSRIHVRLPGGGMHELRKDDVPRKVHDADVNPAIDYTGTFYSVDGTRLRFETSTNTLYLPDGSCYVFSPRTSSQQSATQYIDRNGNTLTYAANGQVVDTLSRSFSYPLPARPVPGGTDNYGYVPNWVNAGDYAYALPGVGGTSKTFTFRWRYLRDVLSDPTHQLGYRGEHPCSPLDPRKVPAPHLFESYAKRRVCSESQLFDPVVLHEVVLPNGTSYKFTYNVYGEIDKVVYPTGGYDRFRYAQIESLGSVQYAAYRQGNRGVVERWVSPSGSGGVEAHWQYSAAKVNGSYLVTQTAPDGSYTESYLHGGTYQPDFGLDTALSGRGFDTKVYASQGGAMVRRTLTEWVVSGPVAGGASWWASNATRDPKEVKQVTLLLDTGNASALAALTVNRYEQASQPLNITSATEYDFTSVDQTIAQTGDISNFVPDPSLALRTTETGYSEDASYLARNLVSLPTAVVIRSGGLAGPQMAQTMTAYDELTYPLITYGPSFNGWADPQTPVRGNMTTTKEWLNTESKWIETHSQYDQFGNKLNAREAHNESDATHGTALQTEYSPTYQYAYPTHSILPPPDATGQQGSGASSEINSEYDFQTGLIKSVTNANGYTTTYEYNDSLNRLKKVVRPPGGGWTSFEYGDSSGDLFVQTKTKLDDARAVEAYQYFDGLGRAVRAYKYTGATSASLWSVIDTEYDAMGRVRRVSNPYFSPDRSGTGAPTQWTTTEYDVLGRAVSISSPGGAVARTDFAGNGLTGTDQAGKVRRTVSDALGRLSSVYEAPNAAGYNYLATYSYDALNNLIGVAQGQQARTFVYDSLKRLILVRQPEQDAVLTDARAAGLWSMRYSYYSKGQLESRTDSRGVTTTYQYDKHGRLLSRAYTVAGSPANYEATPSASYYYDGTGMPAGIAPAPNSKGRLTAVRSSNSETVYTEFDAMSRVTKHRQITDGQSYLMEYGYDLAGSLIKQQYPSGKVIVPEHDSAGRLAGAKNQQTGSYYVGAGATDPARIQYSAHGAVAALKLGNGKWEYTGFNERLQPIEIGLGNSATDASLFRLDYTYGVAVNGTLDPTKNNGNVQSQTTTAEGQSWRQTYEYDALNRLAAAQETKGGATVWQQVFGYDLYGNRRFATGTTAPAVSSAGDPVNNPTSSEATNRLAVGQGYAYDRAGNLTVRPGYSHWYDGESRMVKADDGQPLGLSAYSYDGDGRRVKKVTGSGSGATVFVYDAAGRVVAEYTNFAPQQNGTRYLTSDHLGSPRVITGSDGSIKSRRDFRPFGEEIGGFEGDRDDVSGYGADDNLTRKFTTYDRDTETKLDYAQARYYMSQHGRFISPDPLLASGTPSMPQSWNRYAYCINNPTILVDPSGLIWGALQIGKHTWRYAWFKGDTLPAGWKPVAYIDGSRDIPLANGTTVRLFQNGTYQYLGGTGRFRESGRGNINAALGFLHGAVPGGKLATDALGVHAEENAGEYRNMSAIGTGLSTAEAVFSGAIAVTAVRGALRGAASLADDAARVADDVVELADDALVVRGGRNMPENFANGSGVTVDGNGLLQGVSVNSAPGRTVKELAEGIPHNRIGVTTVGDIRAIGGDVIPSGTRGNPLHCTMCGVTPEQAHKLFRPTIPNPNK